MVRSTFLLLLFLLLTTCTEETEVVPIDFGYDYFPLGVGRQWTYRTDSLIYRPGAGSNQVDTLRRMTRVRLTDTLRDNTGALLYRAERYGRTDSTGWQLQSVFTLGREEQRAFTIEGNLRFISLVFPVETGRTWEGHAFLDSFQFFTVAGNQIQLLKNWDYAYETVDAPFALEDTSYGHTTTVRLAEAENIIELRRGRAVYARGVGLIYRELDLLDARCALCCGGDLQACQALPWSARAYVGFSLREVLIDYR